MTEFQVLLLGAGKGSRMNNLAESKGKCLLPIGSYPMIWYPLHYLQSNGFNEVIIIAPESIAEAVQDVPDKYDLSIKLDVVSLPEFGADDEELGTADAIRIVKDKIKNDLLVISCDLLTNFDLNLLMRVHRNNNSSFTALFSEASELKYVPGQKEKQKQEHDLIGFDPDTSRLVFITSEADLDETFDLRKKLLKQHPVIQIRRDLADAHLYLMKQWVIEFIASKRDLTSLKGEIFPALLKLQYKSKISTVHVEEEDVEPEQETIKNIISPEVKLIEQLSCYNDHHGDLEESYHGQNLRCYFVLTKPSDVCVRVNTTATYFDINTKVAKIWDDLIPGSKRDLIHPTAEITNKTQISPDTVIGEYSVLRDKISIKHCIIGSKCLVEEKVRLTNCIVMNNVTVKEGSVVQNTILSDNTVVDERCDIKDCIVESGQILHSGAKFSREIVADTGKMMEI